MNDKSQGGAIPNQDATCKKCILQISSTSKTTRISDNKGLQSLLIQNPCSWQTNGNPRTCSVLIYTTIRNFRIVPRARQLLQKLQRLANNQGFLGSWPRTAMVFNMTSAPRRRGINPPATCETRLKPAGNRKAPFRAVPLVGRGFIPGRCEPEKIGGNKPA